MDTKFYVYYGSPGAPDGANPAGVWDSNHLAVWHLGEIGGAQPDSTANANHLDAYGTVEEGSAGIVGKAHGFDGESTNVCYLATSSATYPTFDTTKGLTLSAWAHPTNNAPIDGTLTILCIGGGNWAPFWAYYFGYYRLEQMRGYASGSAGYSNHGSYGKLGTGFPRDTWSHVAMTEDYDEDEDASTMRLYVDGSLIFSDTVAGKVLRETLSGKPLVVGARTHSKWPDNQPVGYFFNGWIDEPRISNTRRSEAWLAASYRSQKPDSTMLSFGGLEPSGGSIVLIR